MGTITVAAMVFSAVSVDASKTSPFPGFSVLSLGVPSAVLKLTSMHGARPNPATLSRGRFAIPSFHNSCVSSSRRAGGRNARPRTGEQRDRDRETAKRERALAMCATLLPLLEIPGLLYKLACRREFEKS